MGYDEINLNVGCPSPRVQHGAFGACLMKEPKLVSECIASMIKAVPIPVTIKCRLGVDDLDSYEFAHDFIKETSEKSGCKHYVVHARKAFLKGLSPAENRHVPPLQYDRVVKLKEDFPDLDFTINGGFKTIDQVAINHNR
jgi:tRNA-dihydrouridine synthase A